MEGARRTLALAAEMLGIAWIVLCAAAYLLLITQPVTDRRAPNRVGALDEPALALLAALLASALIWRGAEVYATRTSAGARPGRQGDDRHRE